MGSAHFGSTYAKIETIERRLAWPYVWMTHKFMKHSCFKINTNEHINKYKGRWNEF